MKVIYRLFSILLLSLLFISPASADEIALDHYEPEVSELLNLVFASEQDPEPEKMCCKLICKKGGGFGARVLKSYWAKSKDKDECKGMKGDPCGATSPVTGRYETGIYSYSWKKCP